MSLIIWNKPTLPSPYEPYAANVFSNTSAYPRTVLLVVIKSLGLNMYGIIWFSLFFSPGNLIVQTLFVIAADYMPLQPVEDEDDTVINFLYPQEPPVRSFCGFVSLSSIT